MVSMVEIEVVRRNHMSSLCACSFVAWYAVPS